MSEPTAYLDELNFNTRKFAEQHTIKHYTPEHGEAPRIVRVCRCWQSTKFPYCDDTHKQLNAVGDNVGPFVARLNPKPTLTQRVTATHDSLSDQDATRPHHVSALAEPASQKFTHPTQPRQLMWGESVTLLTVRSRNSLASLVSPSTSVRAMMLCVMGMGVVGVMSNKVGKVRRCPTSESVSQ
eukprot:GHVN01021590.1.p1 GENE.GHVN01021590.1~~GHVN01021590.1.p1  ORF type:complete len:183 (+),score=42.29 GHVN01021590.1:87-635(+)